MSSFLLLDQKELGKEQGDRAGLNSFSFPELTLRLFGSG